MLKPLLVGALALVLVPAAALLALREHVPLSADTRTVAAASASVVAGAGALGRVEPASRVLRLSHGAGPEGARVGRLLVREGEMVRAGQVLAEFHDLPRKEAALAQAEAALALAEARLARILAAGRDTEIAAARARLAAARAAEENALREARRAEALLRTAAGNEAAWDRARFAAAQATAERTRAEAELEALLAPRAEDVAVARAEVAQARAAAAEARAARDLALLVSPIDGTVLKIHAREGERVGSDGVLELADLTAFDVVAEIYETDLPRVRLGAAAEVTVPGEPRPFPARVVDLGWRVGRQSVISPDPVAAIDSRVVEVRLRLDPSANETVRRRTNMQVQVAIRP
ncbi:MAG: efflux RND transporter periplasmic adaptor subunit [Elioraea sp.]|nr:efflux RND transporter periplasmic adaptor subunit [Elioraea sp.]MDW8444918.1 efflux RND transporter periplasmic adaptor subunit [Acetobacteraceae bacterium]